MMMILYGYGGGSSGNDDDDQIITETKTCRCKFAKKKCIYNL